MIFLLRLAYPEQSRRAQHERMFFLFVLTPSKPIQNFVEGDGPGSLNLKRKGPCT